jgi:aminoglycoside phosphotransferase (APT) family kinase protein
MDRVGWLEDASEASLRSALSRAAPGLADLPLRMSPVLSSPNPLWWSSSAVIDESFVVKFAWSQPRAQRLWREGMILERLRSMAPALAIPDVVLCSADPALVVTRMVGGGPLDGEWMRGAAGSHARRLGSQLATFLTCLHEIDAGEVLRDLPIVRPTPQASTVRLRRRFPRLVDPDRASSVLRWCDWVEAVLGDHRSDVREVLVHGDLHGYNQLWDQDASVLAAVVDFEESGLRDPHFDLRYLPGLPRSSDLVLATIDAYEELSGRRLLIERVMAWNVLTVLGDALWRTEAGVALPGGGTVASWVDDLERRLAALQLG